MKGSIGSKQLGICTQKHHQEQVAIALFYILNLHKITFIDKNLYEDIILRLLGGIDKG